MTEADWNAGYARCLAMVLPGDQIDETAERGGRIPSGFVIDRIEGSRPGSTLFRGAAVGACSPSSGQAAEALLCSASPISIMKPLHIITLAALAGSVHAGTEAPSPSAAPLTTAPAESGWWFRAAPYGWLTAIDGDITIGPLSAPVDISIADTLDTLDMAVMGLVEAGYDKWSLGVDVVYGKTSDDFDAGGRVFDSFRFEQKQWLVSPFVAYRAIETERYHMDVFAGARFTIIEADLTGRLVHGGDLSVGRDTDWVDPIVGIRGQGALTDTLFFRYNGDIGGFGASSDLVWQAFFGLGYRVNNNVNVALGYRGLGIDYSKDNFALDTVTHGPVIGLEVKW